MTRSAARRANRNAYRVCLSLDIEELDDRLYRNGSFDPDMARQFAGRESPAVYHEVHADINWPLVAERINRDGTRSVQERIARV